MSKNEKDAHVTNIFGRSAFSYCHIKLDFKVPALGDWWALDKSRLPVVSRTAISIAPQTPASASNVSPMGFVVV